MGTVHAQRGRALVHHSHKSILAAPHVFPYRHGGIVGAGNADRFEHIIQRHLFAGLQPDLAPSHTIRMLGDRDKIIQRDLAGFQCLESQKQGHDFGDGGNGALFVGVFFVQDRAGILVDQDGGLTWQVKVRDSGRYDVLRQRRRRARKGQRQTQQKSRDPFFHGICLPFL